MTRRPFAGTGAEVLVDATGVNGGATVRFYDAESGGTQITDLQTPEGAPITGGLITAGTYGQIPRFLGPNDGRAKMWADAGLGRLLLLATDGAERAAQLEATSARVVDGVLIDPGGDPIPTGGDPLTDDQESILATAARVVAGVLVDPDGDPIANPGGFPVPVDRGHYTPDTDYVPGDLFTYDGVRLLTVAPFTAGTTPDPAKVVQQGIDPGFAVAFDDTGLDSAGSGSVVLRDGAGGVLLTMTGVVARTLIPGAGGPPADPPAQLTGLAAVAGSSAGTVDLSWSAVTDASAYQIRYAPTGTTSWSAWTSGGTSTTYTATGLDAGAQLDFQARALNSGGAGPASTTVGPVTVPGDEVSGTWITDDWAGPFTDAATLPRVGGGTPLTGSATVADGSRFDNLIITDHGVDGVLLRGETGNFGGALTTPLNPAPSGSYNAVQILISRVAIDPAADTVVLCSLPGIGDLYFRRVDADTFQIHLNSYTATVASPQLDSGWPIPGIADTTPLYSYFSSGWGVITWALRNGGGGKVTYTSSGGTVALIPSVDTDTASVATQLRLDSLAGIGGAFRGVAGIFHVRVGVGASDANLNASAAALLATVD